MRLIRRAPRDQETPDLGPTTIAILLAGWSAQPPVPSPHGFEGGFLDLYDPDDQGFIRLWRAHEWFLRDTANHWHWTPTFRGPDGVMRFYAEHLAAGYA